MDREILGLRVWLAALLFALMGAFPVFAQQAGQVTELVINSPPPGTFNSGNPFRTNSPILRIEYTHNGNSGNYFVTSDGADSEGTSFLPQPSDKTGDMFVDVRNAMANNPKTINLTLLQTRINVVAQTNVPVVVVFDATAPTLNLLSLRLNGMGGVGGTVLGLVPPTAAPTPGSTPTGSRVFTVAGSTGVFRTRADSIEIAANANDVFTPLAQVQASNEIPEAGFPDTVVAPVAGQPGSFNAAFSLAGKTDGTYTLTVRANDQVNDPFTTATLIKGNVTVPHVVQIIRDTTAPQVTAIEILRPLTPTADGNNVCGRPAETLTTGTTAFVGTEAVGIRLTFNEPITLPRVTVQQNAATAESQLQPVTQPTARTTKFTYQFQPNVVEAQNGPVILRISGRNVGTQSPQDPGEGTDEAGNGVTPTNTAPLVFPNAFVVDTFAPDLRSDLPVRLRTSPFLGQVIASDQIFINSTGGQTTVPGKFPKILSAQILDLPPGNTLTPNFASGVDFAQITASGAATTVTSSGRLSITLAGPNGPIPALPGSSVISGSPPSLLQAQIYGDSIDELDGNPNFQRQPSGLLRPVEGTYTMTINMIDRVCNSRVQRITFTVDNTPVRESDLQVRVGGVLIGRRGFCVQGTAGQPPTEFPTISVRSLAADFSTTNTRFTVGARINGMDADEYPTVLTTYVVDVPGRTVSADIVNVVGTHPEVAVGSLFPTAPQTSNNLAPGERDPRLGEYDGPYIIHITPRDVAGNVGAITTSTPGFVETLDYAVNFDSLMPYTERTFPKDGSFITAPLRIVDSTLIDPPAIRRRRVEVLGRNADPLVVSHDGAVPGCGIDDRRSLLFLRLEVPYQPVRAQASGFLQSGSAGGVGKIGGTLTFTHEPNSTNPDEPDYLANDDRWKVALEIAKGNNQVTSLPGDKSMDGVYSISSLAVDKAGLFVAAPTSFSNGTVAPPRQGNYFGINDSATTTESIVGFTWIYDTVSPLLHIDNLPGPVEIASTVTIQNSQALTLPGAATSQHKVVNSNPNLVPAFLSKNFKITGFARDLSARDDPFAGGSGMQRVEYELKLVDNNGQTVPLTGLTNLLGSPCPTASQSDGNVVAGCKNPIISLKAATLTTFPGYDLTGATPVAIDPLPSLTDPIFIKPGAVEPPQTAFETQVRPKHNWVIQDSLPDFATIPRPRPVSSAAPGDKYRLTIRAIDRAGNVSEIQSTVTLGNLQAPGNLSPANDACVRGNVVLAWSSSNSNISTHIVTVTPPNASVQGVSTFRVGGGALTTTYVAQAQGLYTWTVQAVDSVGGVSAISSATFRVDSKAPRVENITFGNDVIPTTNTGVINRGKVYFDVAFDEPISNPPTLTFDPADATIPAQPTTVQTDNSTTPKTHWKYEGVIPDGARAATWDGIATLRISGGADTCGNEVIAENLPPVEIDTGPDFESGFFFNPVAPQEIVLTIVASEQLSQVPALADLQGVEIVSAPTIFPSSPRSFYSTLKLTTPNVESDVSLTVSMQDLDGNASKRKLTFRVTPISQFSSAMALSVDRRLSVNVPEGAVIGSLPLYVLPANDPTKRQAASSVHKLFPTAGTAKSAAVLAAQEAKPPTDQALKILQYLNELAPGGVVLQKPAVVTALTQNVTLPQGATPGQMGLYVWNGAKWTWTGSSHDGSSIIGMVRNLGPLAVALDQAPPTLAATSFVDGERLDQSQPELTATVADVGAGVGADGVKVLIDDAAVDFSYKEETGDVTFRPTKPLPPGDHMLSLAVKDRAGNAAQTTKMKLVAPAPFGLSELIAYPNPARIQSRIRARLTQPAVTQRVAVDIYDVASQRVARLSQDAPFTSSAVDLVWDLVNERGHGVANGVYLYQTTVTSTTGQKVRARGKIAVQR